MNILFIRDLAAILAESDAYNVQQLLIAGLTRKKYNCRVIARSVADNSPEVRLLLDPAHQDDNVAKAVDIVVHDNVEIHTVAHAAMRDYLVSQLRSFEPEWVLVASDDPHSVLETALQARPERVVYIARDAHALADGPAAAELLGRVALVVRTSRETVEQLERWAGLTPAIVAHDDAETFAALLRQLAALDDRAAVPAKKVDSSDLRARLQAISPEKRALLARRAQKKERDTPQSIPRLSRESATFPLSFAQQRLWFVYQLQQDNSVYNEFAAMRLLGSLDLAALERGLNALVGRHEVLRTTFALIDQQPVQVVAPAQTLPLRLIDLRALPAAVRTREAQRLATSEARQPFDLARGPLLRTTLLRLGADTHTLLLALDHIINDGWSWSVLFRELTAGYKAAGELAPQLPPLPIQYADYAVWQRTFMQGALLEAQLAYWRHALKDVPALLELPTDRPRPLVRSFRGARQALVVPQPLTRALNAVGQQAGCTLFMVLLASFQMLLARYTAQTDIVVGTDIANRTPAETEGLIGFFVNQLVLRTDLAGNPTFYELLTLVQQNALGAYSHQDLPFEYLVKELNPERSLSHTPLFQVKLILQNTPMPVLELPNLAVSRVVIDKGRAQFDLLLELYEEPQGIVGWFEYDSDLFDAPTIARMLRHFQILLAGSVANPERRIGDLALLSAAEQQQLREWNATMSGVGGTGGSRTARTGVRSPISASPLIADIRCFHELFALQAEQTPDAIAVAFADAHLSYRELNARANQLAQHLRAFGVGPEVLVALCMERSLELLIGVFGVLKAGGAYLPLDPAYPSDRLAFMLEDSQVPVLLTQERLVDALPTTWAMVVCLDGDWDAIAQQPSANQDSAAHLDNLAYVIYTSGSTGTPKGVTVMQRGLGNLVAAQMAAFDVRADSRVLQFASLSFDAAISEIGMALLAGATLCLARQDERLPGLALVRLIRELHITTATLPPSALAVVPLVELPTLRTLIVAGEACPAELAARWAHGRRLCNAYGPTEATVCATIFAWDAPAPQLPIGRSIANTQLYLLDQRMRPVPIGVAGELYLGGVGLARGYLNRPRLTAARFVPNPFAEVSGIGYRVLGAERSDTRYPSV